MAIHSSVFDSTEYDLISRYRMMEQDPIIADAIEDITNEAIVFDDNEMPVSLNIDDAAGISEFTKEKIVQEFKRILILLDFKTNGDMLFRRWYVDGRLIFHKIIDAANPHYGLLEIRRIEPHTIKRIQISDSVNLPNTQGILLYKGKPTTYYMYSQQGFGNWNPAQVNQNPTFTTQQAQHTPTSVAMLNLTEDSITFGPSGLLDYSKGGGIIVSYLNPAIKPHNQLNMMEDTMVIYQLTRAVERRVFGVDVGDMYKHEAEVYMQEQVDRYRTRLAYDTTTGSLTSRNNYMAIQEDLWIPKREGGGWDVTTLDAGKSMADNKGNTEYFMNKLYQALHLPPSRLQDSNSSFRIGNPNEIMRDELRFSKFIDRLRNRFSFIFYDILRTQLLLKNVCTPDDWDRLRSFIQFKYRSDVHFAELKEAELLKMRIELVSAIDPLVQRGWYSEEYVREKILKQTTEMRYDIGDNRNINQQAQPLAPLNSSGSIDIAGSSPSSIGGGGTPTAPPETPKPASPPELTFNTGGTSPESPTT